MAKCKPYRKATRVLSASELYVNRKSSRAETEISWYRANINVQFSSQAPLVQIGKHASKLLRDNSLGGSYL